MTIPEYIPREAQKTFLDQIAEGNLLCFNDTATTEIYTPPLGSCVNCANHQFEWVPLEGKGTVETYTAIFVAAPEFAEEVNIKEQTGFVVGIVRLENGSNVAGRLLGVEAKEAKTIKIGAPVTMIPYKTPSGKPLLAFQL
ncbi:MAG: Zn-ribbon domain-containing OB-fold protein [Candidatus Ranarchaeia archaeon]|jgi:uncharacterized OB-fold protein